MEVRLELAYHAPQEVCELFTEYIGMLLDEDRSFEEYLSLQNYDEELGHLEAKYGLPAGRLYLAYDGEELAGCIGLRRIDDES